MQFNKPLAIARYGIVRIWNPARPERILSPAMPMIEPFDDCAALIAASRVHITRLRALLEMSHHLLGRTLLDEAQRYILLIEQIEAGRIERLHEAEDA